MRILLANKFYYTRGGVEIYTIELEKLLKENGDDVGIFAMQHPLNMKSEFTSYFPSEIQVGNNKAIKGLIPLIFRPFGSTEVRKKFSQLIYNFKPDIIHLNNIHTQLSPILAKIAHNYKIPVVWTIHDHKLLCPRYDCTRDGKPCELCFYKKHNVIRYKCMKNSYIASVLAYFEAIVWSNRTLSRLTNIFICPSKFLMKNMIKGNFNPLQMISLPNFILDHKLTGYLVPRENYYCYIGRSSSEKGIETLLKAAIELPQFRLKIIGTGPMEDDLKERFKQAHIEFLGYKTWNDVKSVLAGSQFMVIPSECYENNPLSVIESLCLGTPVVGANIGGIPELIEPGVNGYTFEPGNIADLKMQIINTFNFANNFDNTAIASKARETFGSTNYYNQLMKIYNSLLAK